MCKKSRNALRNAMRNHVILDVSDNSLFHHYMRLDTNWIRIILLITLLISNALINALRKPRKGHEQV